MIRGFLGIFVDFSSILNSLILAIQHSCWSSLRARKLYDPADGAIIPCLRPIIRGKSTVSNKKPTGLDTMLVLNMYLNFNVATPKISVKINNFMIGYTLALNLIHRTHFLCTSLWEVNSNFSKKYSIFCLQTSQSFSQGLPVYKTHAVTVNLLSIPC